MKFNKKMFSGFCRNIYKNHPQGNGILKYKFWLAKYNQDLIEAYEYFTI